MNKSDSNAFKNLFLKHFTGFLSRVTTAAELAGPHAIAVSGGADSMCLLWLAHQLSRQGMIGPVRAIFVHHHTRHGQDQDQELVTDFCEDLNIPCRVLHAQGLEKVKSNFENQARLKRRDLLLNEIQSSELLWLGHHLDDSFEWTLMQRNRSSVIHSSLGIPVRNKSIVRPLMCLSRTQISKFIDHQGISFRNDPTNLDVSFDRNYLRLKVIPLIKKRYPKYLKHYVNQANLLASVLKLNVRQQRDDSELYTYQDGSIFVGCHFSTFEVQQLLHQYSHQERGKITTQIQRMMQAIEKGKKGPYHFSGGTEVYHSHRLLMIYRQKFQNEDKHLANLLTKFSSTELESLPKTTYDELKLTWENLLKRSESMAHMPGLILVIENKSIQKTLNTSVFDSLFPEVSSVCQKKGYRFLSCLKALSEWEKKRQKLPESLRFLPLWTLSNLSSSQE